MDGPSAPWRALESPAAAAASTPGDPGGAGGSIDRHVASTIAVLAVAGLLAAVAIWLVVGSGRGSVVVDGAGNHPSSSGLAVSRPPDDSGGSSLVVDVQGAVVHPGVVRLPAGSRVGDAIAAAGGFGPRVASDRVGVALNLAALLHDGDQVRVPSRDDPVAGTGGAPGGPEPSGDSGGLVDLNHATDAELDGLPGVGPATAAKIIAAREEQPFASVDDLRTRKIVGAATFEKLKDLVTVR